MNKIIIFFAIIGIAVCIMQIGGVISEFFKRRKEKRIKERMYTRAEMKNSWNTAKMPISDTETTFEKFVDNLN